MKINGSCMQLSLKSNTLGLLQLQILKSCISPYFGMPKIFQNGIKIVYRIVSLIIS